MHKKEKQKAAKEVKAQNRTKEKQAKGLYYSKKA